MHTVVNTVDLRKQVDALRATLGTMQAKQFPFAWRWAAEATLKEAAHEVEKNIRSKFRTSSEGRQFLLNHVKVMGPNSKLGLTVGGTGKHAIGIVPPQGKGAHRPWSRYRGSLLAMMEEGGNTPGPVRFGAITGSNLDLGNYAIPMVPYAMRPRMPLKLFPFNLGIAERQSIDGVRAGGSLQGKQRTYMAPLLNSPGHAVIYQRYGKERDATMPLFWTQRETRLPARRFFFSTARAEIAKWMPQHLKGAMEHALFGRGRYTGGW